MPEILNAHEVKARLRGSPRPILVEALPEKYYRDRHLPGALHLPHDAPEAEIRRVLPDPREPVIVYCASGPCENSGELTRRLAKLGYSRVADFHEGKEGWENAGYPFERA